MQKNLFIISLLLCLTTISAESLLNNLKQGSLNGFNTLEGVTSKGAELLIINSDPFITNRQDRVTNEVIEQFTHLSFKTVKINYTNSDIVEIEFIIHPLNWNSLDLDKFLTSGLTIKVTDVVKYEVDIFIESLHIHVNGIFLNEESLLNKLTNIISHPGDFLLSRDPEHIMNKFYEIDNVITELKKENELLKLENDKLSETLVKEQKELNELKYNNLVMESRGLFGNIKKLNRDDVEWIIQTKEENPTLSAEEIRDQILIQKGSKTPLNIISLIFGLYFGEYDS